MCYQIEDSLSNNKSAIISDDTTCGVNNCEVLRRTRRVRTHRSDGYILTNNPLNVKYFLVISAIRYTSLEKTNCLIPNFSYFLFSTTHKTHTSIPPVFSCSVFHYIGLKYSTKPLVGEWFDFVLLIF